MTTKPASIFLASIQLYHYLHLFFQFNEICYFDKKNMEGFFKNVTIRWSDLDPNFHVRHSVYYDWGAYVRICYLNETGLTPQLLLQHHLGPILFREEAIFKKEIHFNDVIYVNVSMRSATASGTRWSLQHELLNKNGTLHAIINIDGAWMDTKARKLTEPPEIFLQKFLAMPKTENFMLL
ncbi:MULTISPECIES: acyl-CoA thioesterase [unclassified Hydrotalea]|uniref:acyl-CoA thioesterase n=1 Tax=unclassified Hydrotalea TaxID=2643788 RepID=UPI001FDEF7F5|nr:MULTISPECIES: acyl-CoA thioesterase [unclassified Hydrotalea]